MKGYRGIGACAAICLGLASAPVAPAEPPPVVVGAEVMGGPMAAGSFDGKLTELPAPHHWKPGDPVRVFPRQVYPRPIDRQGTLAPWLAEAPKEPVGWRDPVRQEAAETPAAISAFTTPTLNFDAFSFTAGYPPDVAGEAGPDHYVAMINGNTSSLVRWYDKQGSQVAEYELNSLWTAGLPGDDCDTKGAGDPVPLYDSLAGRWVLTMFTTHNVPTPNKVCVAVAKTADPINGGWWLYSFTTPEFPDYPHFGVWQDAYYVGTNESAASRTYALDRTNMLTGATARAPQRFDVAKMAAFGFQLLSPVDVDGSVAPPAGAGGIFLRQRDDEVQNVGSNNPAEDYLELYEFKVDFDTPANSALLGPTNIPVAEYSSELCGTVGFQCVPQPGTAQKLDPLREPVMERPRYYNRGGYEQIVAVWTTDANGSDLHGSRWVELRRTGGTWSVYQQGTYSPDAVNRWMPSIAMDRSGNMALGYSVSDATSVQPGLRYVGRRSFDAAGQMTTGETTIVNGAGFQAQERWGDYHSMSIDPADGCTFWFTGEYAPGSDWQTRVASFRFEQCGIQPPADFDADVRTDLAVFHDATGLWFLRSSADGTTNGFGFGGSGYIPVPADYDGDWRTDPAMYHPPTGLWFFRSPAGVVTSQGWGGPDYEAVPGDYDGDGKVDVAAFHTALGLWFIRQSSQGGALLSYDFGGGGGYITVPRDYDGDGRTDLAVYNPSTGLWYVRNSSTGSVVATGFGGSAYKPVPGDYDGDGKADIAVYHNTLGIWFIKNSSTGAITSIDFGGGPGYTPVPGRFDGDNKLDLGLYNESTGLWFWKLSSTGAVMSQGYGGPGYTPVAR